MFRGNFRGGDGPPSGGHRGFGGGGPRGNFFRGGMGGPQRFSGPPGYSNDGHESEPGTEEHWLEPQFGSGGGHRAGFQPQFRDQNVDGSTEGYHPEQGGQFFRGRGRGRPSSRGPRGGFDGPHKGGGFNGPQRGGGFDGPHRGGGFDGPHRGSFGGPQRGGFDGPQRGGSFDGPQRGGSFDGPQRGGSFDGPQKGGINNQSSRGGYGGPQRGGSIAGFSGPSRDDGFDGSSHNDFQGYGQRSFEGPPRGGGFSGPSRWGEGGPSREVLDRPGSGLGGPLMGKSDFPAKEDFGGSFDNATKRWGQTGPLNESFEPQDRGGLPRTADLYRSSRDDFVHDKREPCGERFPGEEPFRSHLVSNEHQRQAERFIPGQSQPFPQEPQLSSLLQQQMAAAATSSLSAFESQAPTFSGYLDQSQSSAISEKPAFASTREETAHAIPACREQKPRIARHPALPGEDEPPYDDGLVILDWYNSDLNLKICKDDFCSAKAMSQQGFGYIWAGARATYGATRGKVCYEVHIDSNCDVSHLEAEEMPNVLRCGWSVDDASMQLGEEPLSFGYGGTGKISTECKFRDYGINFGVGDVVGCFLDMTSDPILMKYTVNGYDQGVAFRVPKQSVGNRALFPHILVKNQDFSVNFGQMPSPLRNLLPDYSPIGQLDLSEGLIRGSEPPPSRSASEALLMIGLPGAGKSWWAEKYKRQHPEKKVNILGTNSLIERMKVQGLPRKNNYHGRWEILINKCTEVFNDILKLAAKRRRNYILDQTNVFPTARSRKMKDFEGFCCKAIVVVPSDDEFQRRVLHREGSEGKEIPDSAVLNMKANFVLPDIEEIYASEVIYTELGPTEAAKLVSMYNQEAFSKGIQMTGGVKSFIRNNAKKRGNLGEFGVIGKHESEVGPSFIQPTVDVSHSSSEINVDVKEDSNRSDRGTRGSRRSNDKGRNGGSRSERRSRSRTSPSKERRSARDQQGGRRSNRSRSSSKDKRRGGRDRNRRRRSRSKDRRGGDGNRKGNDRQQQGGVPSPWATGGSAQILEQEMVGPMFSNSGSVFGNTLGNLEIGVSNLGGHQTFQPQLMNQQAGSAMNLQQMIVGGNYSFDARHDPVSNMQNDFSNSFGEGQAATLQGSFLDRQYDGQREPGVSVLGPAPAVSQTSFGGGGRSFGSQLSHSQELTAAAGADPNQQYSKPPPLGPPGQMRGPPPGVSDKPVVNTPLERTANFGRQGPPFNQSSSDFVKFPGTDDQEHDRYDNRKHNRGPPHAQGSTSSYGFNPSRDPSNAEFQGSSRFLPPIASGSAAGRSSNSFPGGFPRNQFGDVADEFPKQQTTFDKNFPQGNYYQRNQAPGSQPDRNALAKSGGAGGSYQEYPTITPKGGSNYGHASKPSHPGLDSQTAYQQQQHQQKPPPALARTTYPPFSVPPPNMFSGPSVPHRQPDTTANANWKAPPSATQSQVTVPGIRPQASWQRQQQDSEYGDRSQSPFARTAGRQSPGSSQRLHGFMNPPNPNSNPTGSVKPPSAASEASSSSSASGSGTAAAPDYKALLQYLQFYQKQMGADGKAKENS